MKTYVMKNWIERKPSMGQHLPEHRVANTLIESNSA